LYILSQILFSYSWWVITLFAGLSFLSRYILINTSEYEPKHLARSWRHNDHSVLQWVSDVMIF
jgi:hypothetical protein